MINTVGRPLVDLEGQTFGRLTVMSREGSRNKQAVWLCQCACGVSVSVAGGNLRSGRQVSCGCRQDEARKERLGRNLTDSPAYMTAHTRNYAAKGKASEYDCAHCQGVAAEWAYDHEDADELTALWQDQQGNLRPIKYSSTPDHYMALCRPCHRRFDRD